MVFFSWRMYFGFNVLVCVLWQLFLSEIRMFIYSIFSFILMEISENFVYFKCLFSQISKLIFVNFHAHIKVRSLYSNFGEIFAKISQFVRKFLSRLRENSDIDEGHFTLSHTYQKLFNLN